MNAAISCGKRIIPNITTTAAQSNTFPSQLPRTEHCFARRCCQNPTPRSATERPMSQGRSSVKNALAVPVPRAAANPSGKQQLIEAIELRIVINDAEMPVPCFTVDVPAFDDSVASVSLISCPSSHSCSHHHTQREKTSSSQLRPLRLTGPTSDSTLPLPHERRPEETAS